MDLNAYSNLTNGDAQLPEISAEVIGNHDTSMTFSSYIIGSNQAFYGWHQVLLSLEQVQTARNISNLRRDIPRDRTGINNI